ncbi:uncharacterized protein LOC115875354 [Sitophilus oryzae]|uniref:Uncharacterized protein LOC115875354 n=1 Tax=Sitophilus oryzae TaxID=7048 RepID=A0A6J2X639_SITOR|nr:uncharacterized protein LOC115875354 [Sitophilus oryzae]XP_030746641.1 uncharacterized protein LOC115875354 [Sitophilus oryzae]
MAASGDLNSIYSVCQELVHLSKSETIVDDIKHFISLWDYREVNSLSQFKEDLIQVVDEIENFVLPENNNPHIKKLIYCFVLSEIYDFIISLIRSRFSNDDMKMYMLSKRFCLENGNPKQLGSTFYNFVPNAAIVELSMLNTKRTAAEKLCCLCSAYEYIFAEVKSALISIISKYSEKENNIPIINNKEVVPIVMAVILKSKLFYLISDMYFIRYFGSDILEENKDMKNIYQIFEDSIHKLFPLFREPIPAIRDTEKLENHLGVCETINFIEKINSEVETKQTIFQEETRRVAKLIISATTEDLCDN